MSVPIKEIPIYFSYSQFWIYDQDIFLPGCLWSQTHIDQGFARRESTVCFGTKLEYGEAIVRVFLGPYVASNLHERVIAVPIHLPTGQAIIGGPEDTEEEEMDQLISLTPGHYQLTAAQIPVDYEEMDIEVFFEQLAQPAKHSRILIADDLLCPPSEEIEDSEIAEQARVKMKRIFPKTSKRQFYSNIAECGFQL